MARASRQIKLNKVLIQYCKLVDPGESMDGRSKEYAAQFVIPKDHPQVKEIQEQVGEILREAFPGANYSSMKKGLRDSDAGGQAQNQPHMENTYFINAKKLERFGRPPIYNSLGTPLNEDQITPSVIFSGCIVNVVLSFYSFDTSGNKGVAVGIEGVQIVDNVNVSRMDGAPDLGAAFGPVEGAEDNTQMQQKEFENKPAEEEAGEDIPW